MDGGFSARSFGKASAEVFVRGSHAGANETTFRTGFAERRFGSTIGEQTRASNGTFEFGESRDFELQAGNLFQNVSIDHAMQQGDSVRPDFPIAEVYTIGDSYARSELTTQFTANVTSASPVDQLRDIECRNLLSGSLTHVPSTQDPALMNVDFRPNGSVSLAEAARRCGVDHFNWINRITSVPDHVTQYMVEGVLEGRKLAYLGDGQIGYAAGDSPEGETSVISYQVDSAIDPPINYVSAGRRYVEVYEPKPDIGITTPTLGNFAVAETSADDAITFLSEEGLIAIDVFRSTGQIDANVLPFLDRPSTKFELVNPSTDWFGFETSLVGVRSDGSLLKWEGIGTNFTWRTNAAGFMGARVGGVEFEGVRAGVFDNEIAEGGVADVVFDLAVPEPVGGILVMQVIALGMLHRRRVA